MLAEQIEQASILSGRQRRVEIVDLGYRGRTLDGTEILHRGKAKRLMRRQ
jgi:IS5 family transposase